MLEKTKKSKLKVNGIVDDFFKFNPKEKYNVILLDSVIQFYKSIREKETKFLLRILDYVKTGGLVCIFIHKSTSREKSLRSIFKQLDGI